MLKQIAKAAAPPIIYDSIVRCMNAWRNLTSEKDRPARQTEFLRRNASLGLHEIAVDDAVKLRIHPDSRAEFEYMLWRDRRSAAEWAAFTRLSAQRSALLDVGANHGLFSLAFAARQGGKHAVAVDPSPKAIAPLLYNVRANGLEDRVRIVEAAVSDRAGKISMAYSAGETAAVAGSGTLLADAMTGDGLCEKLSFRPDIIKIDVEGHENSAVIGLQETIGTCRPILLVELHMPRRPSGHFEEAAAWLASTRYEAKLVTGGVFDLAALRGQLCNVIFTPR